MEIKLFPLTEENLEKAKFYLINCSNLQESVAFMGGNNWYYKGLGLNICKNNENSLIFYGKSENQINKIHSKFMNILESVVMPKCL